MDSTSVPRISAQAAPPARTADAPVLSPEQVHSISRALADPRRFGIFQQIAQQNTTLCGCLDVKDALSPATISHHLRELQEAGLIETGREGRQVRLTVRRDVWNAYLQQLNSI